MILEVLICQKFKNKNKNNWIFIFGFQCVAKKKKKRMIKICVSYLVYSQIWLNLPKDNCHLFFYIFLLTIANKNPRKYNFTNALPHFLPLQMFLPNGYPQSIPNYGAGKKKSFNYGKDLLRKDIITIREAHARWSRENLTKVPYIRAQKKPCRNKSYLLK